MFKNPEIALDTLPGIEHLDWQYLDPGYKRRLLIPRVLMVLAIGIVVIAGMFILNVPRLQTAVLVAILAIAAVPILIWPLFSVPRRAYVVRDLDIVFRSGVFWRSVTAVPFNRIQHVETSTTPLDRKFGLSTLKLFTAGGSKGDLKIDGLGRTVAEQLRVFILAKAGSSFESA